MNESQRNADLARASAARAIVLPYVNSLTLKKMTATQIQQALAEELKKLGKLKKDFIRNLLKTAAGNRLVESEKVGHTVFYFGKGIKEESLDDYPSSGAEKDEGTDNVLNKRKPYTKRLSATVDGDKIMIDIVKSTGRLRIQAQGLIVEVGFVES